MTVSVLCEYMKNPCGLDMEKPLFSWSLEGIDDDIDSWRIVVSRDKSLSDPLWDSGPIHEKNALSAIYAGDPLSSGVTYFWLVELSSGGDLLRSETATFTMGLLPCDSWKAPWIGGIRIDQESYQYRSEFSVKAGLVSAAAFLSSPCYNCLTINGRKADDSVLNNVFADYAKSLYYATYDITALLTEGRNAAGVLTGLGWHSLRKAEDGIGWGDSLFSLLVRLEYEDGSVVWVAEGPEAWKFTCDGPVRKNSIYNGEVYDARMEMPGWDTAGFDDNAWATCIEKEPPEGKLRSQVLEPIRVVEELPVKEIINVKDGSWTLDFGKIFSGWVRIRVSGKAGDVIAIKPAEEIKPDGSVDPTSLRNAHPEDVYILKGPGDGSLVHEVWEPRFTYHGFRYAQISGLKERPSTDMFTGCVVRSDVTETGSFSCSDRTVQGFYDIVLQTEGCNLHGLPTDCPQRDERLGWLNDMTVRNDAALYSFRLYQLYAKWLRDIRDTQGKVTGAVTDTAPFMRYGFRPADPVSASLIVLPWNLYMQYGDTRILSENYTAVVRWVEYMLRNSDDMIVRFTSMGDWAPPVSETDHDSTGGGALSLNTPPRLMSTGFLYYGCSQIARMARVLGKTEDEARWSELAEKVRSAFNREFFHADGEYYATNSQSSNVLPLFLGMVDEEHVPGVLKNFTDDIARHGGHLTTGNICTRYAVEVLFMYGKEDVAWQLLTNRDYPSWGYMLENGATTLWERWEKVEKGSFQAAMASMCHPMNGGAVVTLYRYLAGIQMDEKNPGWKNIIFRPQVPDKAERAKAAVKTIRGTVSSCWEKNGSALIYKVAVPSGCTGTVWLPGKDEPLYVKSGCHTWNVQ